MAWMPSSKPDAVVAHGEIDLALHAILEAITFAVLEWGGVMARLDRRHPGGARGDWFIDDRCIGCAASATIAPDLIDLSSDGQRFVFIRQPTTDREIVLAQQAAEVCPTRSIGTTSKQRWAPHHPVEIVPGVWRTGWNSPDAVGANAFVVQRSEGNVLIEGPRFTRRVRDAITSLGGLRSILLTHADDVGDAARYADAFGAEVIIHELDADAAPFATTPCREETQPLSLAASRPSRRPGTPPATSCTSSTTRCCSAATLSTSIRIQDSSVRMKRCAGGPGKSRSPHSTGSPSSGSRPWCRPMAASVRRSVTNR
jgi:ferredoxin